jgi:hypothetical protein
MQEQELRELRQQSSMGSAQKLVNILTISVIHNNLS